ncbi:MAG: BrnA antitoxin family protein [Betaproteobacteria bacterium]|nr:BrnA antitoxin family protein [Betaproteobacteria bacterium]
MKDKDIVFDADSPRTRPGDWEGAKVTVGGREVGRVGTRGPQRAPTKVQLSLRLSREVVEYFRATGDGWQSRMDEALREYVAKQRAA